MQHETLPALAELVRPARSSAAAELRFHRVITFLGEYFTRVRRGRTFMVTAPAGATEGEAIQVQISIDGRLPFILPAVVSSLWAGQALIRLQPGEVTTRAVFELLEDSLGRHVAT